jgi:hypothetical protein
LLALLLLQTQILADAFADQRKCRKQERPSPGEPAGKTKANEQCRQEKPDPGEEIARCPLDAGFFLAATIPLCRPRQPSSASACGNCPVNACGIRLTFAPHERQNFDPSISAAQFGQYTFVSSPQNRQDLQDFYRIFRIGLNPEKSCKSCLNFHRFRASLAP